MSRQKNSEFVKAFGTAFEIWKLLVDAVFARGGDDSHLRLLLKKQELVGQLADLIVSAGQKVAEPVASLFTQLLAACKQDWVNPDVNEVHFSLADDGTTGLVEEYCFNWDISSTEAESELEELGFKLVGMKRAMEYIATHPENQLDHPVVVLGARWLSPDGSVRVPFFFRDGGLRRLGLRWVGGDFHSDCRFLVSRE